MNPGEPQQFNVTVLDNAISAQGCADFASNFFEKQEAKSKEQNSGKIGEKLEKWVSENCNLQPIVHCKDGDTLLEQDKSTFTSGKTAKRSRYSNI